MTADMRCFFFVLEFLLIDSKILRNECTYKKLIDVFPKLSVVEYRLVVLPLVKKFLQVCQLQRPVTDSLVLD